MNPLCTIFTTDTELYNPSLNRMADAADKTGALKTSDAALNGLILAGGHSTRMGTDKSLMIYHAVPQRVYLFELLTKYCNEVFTSCRREQQVPSDLNPLYDNAGMPGPMNGILSAFHYKNCAWLVVAVDMPFISADAIEVLLKGRDRNRLATCFINPDSRQPEPLFTVWEPESFPLLAKFADNGNVSPRGFLKTHSVKMIDPPDSKILVNVNSPGFQI